MRHPRSLTRSCCAIVLLVLLPGVAAHAGDGPATATELVAVAGKIDAYLEQLGAFGFSGSVLIAQDGQVLLQRGYGLADRATGRKMTADDAIYIGSLSKQFTAAAILLLERDGLLHTDDPIDVHLSGVPADKSEVRIHHLLTHTSGLIRDLPGDMHELLTVDEMLGRILGAPLATPPGTQFAYSNAGYMMLAAIIAKVSDMPFQEYMRENLFEPAHMKHTCFLGDPQLEKMQLATGYGTTSPDGTSPPQWPVSIKRFGPGGIVSTVGDLYLWDQALQGGDTILTSAEKEKLFTPFKNNYAYGWGIDRAPDGSPRIGHNGGFLGISTHFGHYPDRHLTLIVFCNQEGLSSIVTADLEAWLFGRAPEPLPKVRAMTARDAEARAGPYLCAGGGRCRVLAGDHLAVTPEDALAIGALMLAGKPRVAGEVGAALERKTHTLVEALGRFELAPWRELASAQLRASLSEDSLQADWRRAIAQHGAFQRCEVLGAVQELDGTRVRVYSRSVMAGSAFFESYVWDQEHVVAIQNETAPPRTYIFLPTSDSELAWYDVFTKRTLSARFTSTPSGLELRVPSPGGDVILTRQSSGG